MEESEEKGNNEFIENDAIQEANNSTEQNIEIGDDKSRAGKLYYINADTINSNEKNMARGKNRLDDQGYKYSSEIKGSAYKSPMNEGVKQISSSVLGDKSRYQTKLPNISRQPILEGNTYSQVNASEDEYYTSQRAIDNSANLTQKMEDLGNMQSNKLSYSNPKEIKRRIANMPRYINPAHMNIVEKFLETNLTKNKADVMTQGPISIQNRHKSPNINTVHGKNLPYNDSSQLMKKMKQLEAQLKGLDDEYEILKEENEELVEQNNYMKDINKKLFMKMRDAENVEDIEVNSGNDNNQENPKRETITTNNMDFINETSVGEIHSMYQDLFLTDMKKEVEDAQSELKQFKQETNTANREITILK